MAYTWTAAPDLTDWWKCCHTGCDREVNPAIYTDNKCPDCGHEKCDTCGGVEHPIPPVVDNYHNVHYGNYDNMQHYSCTEHNDHPAYLEEDSPYNQHAEYTFGYGDTQSPEQQDTRAPSMAGWWKCCQCQETVNGNAWGSDCTNCSHGRCDYCNAV